jgi:hypothetical protein
VSKADPDETVSEKMQKLLHTPPSDVNVAAVISILSSEGFPTAAMVVRRLAFQRDQLLEQVDRARKESGDVDR